MKSLEQKTRKRGRRRDIRKIILATVATAGLLSVAALAPNAIQLLAQLGVIDMKKKRKETTIINRARKRLIEKGLLEKDNDGFLRLTGVGQEALGQLEHADFKIKKPKRWDKKWRVLIFDIPEKRKKTREKVRNTLNAIGFSRLQDSVWIYPYDCEDLVALLKADFKIGKDLLYLIVEEIEGDHALRERFDLP